MVLIHLSLLLLLSLSSKAILGDCYSLESRGPDGVAERQSAAPAASEDEPGVDAQVLPQLLNVAHQGLGAALELYYLQLILTWVLLSSSSAWGVDLPQPRWSICWIRNRMQLVCFFIVQLVTWTTLYTAGSKYWRYSA